MLWPMMLKRSIGYGQARNERFHQRAEFPGIGGHVHARVVVQVDRRVAEIVRERRPVIVTLPCPLQVIHAQPVHEHDHFATRRGNAVFSAARVKASGVPFARRRMAMASGLPVATR